MPEIHEIATLTSKGQITLPKSIRQILGVDTGSSVAFDLRDDGEIVVSHVVSEHEDPAIGAFLDLLATDIQKGNVQTLPKELAKVLSQYAGQEVNLDEPIDGDVVI
jgi:antitoxin PrlF